MHGYGSVGIVNSVQLTRVGWKVPVLKLPSPHKIWTLSRSDVDICIEQIIIIGCSKNDKNNIGLIIYFIYIL